MKFSQIAPLTAVGILIALAGIAAAQQSAAGKMSGSTGALSAADKQFAVKAAQGGMAEVALGKLASQHGSSAQVKQFGQRMVQDHGKANQNLMQIAGRESLTLPTSPSAKDEATMAKLSKLSGAAFDRAYIADMVEDHKKDAAEFGKEARTGKDAGIKGFAVKTLPVIKMHLRMAEGIKSGRSGKM